MSIKVGGFSGSYPLSIPYLIPIVIPICIKHIGVLGGSLFLELNPHRVR